MAYRRFGFKYPIYTVTYDIGDRDDYAGIAFHNKDNKYVIKVKFLKKILEIIKEKGQCSIQGGGIKEKIPAEDFFEIAGVEEATHLMFFNEKGHLGAKGVADVGKKLKYYTSEIESRALKWKRSYVRRYMPQYYDTLKETAKNVTEIRLNSIRNQNNATSQK